MELTPRQFYGGILVFLLLLLGYGLFTGKYGFAPIHDRNVAISLFKNADKQSTDSHLSRLGRVTIGDGSAFYLYSRGTNGQFAIPWYVSITIIVDGSVFYNVSPYNYTLDVLLSRLERGDRKEIERFPRYSEYLAARSTTDLKALLIRDGFQQYPPN